MDNDDNDNNGDIHELDIMFNNLDNVVEENHLEYDGNYNNNPLRLLINRMWEKKIQDLETLFLIEDFRIAKDLENLEIGGKTTEEVRANYDNYMENVTNIKNIIQLLNDNRIAPLEALLERMKRFSNANTIDVEELEEQLHKVKTGTLEGLTRHIIAEEGIKTPRGDTEVDDVLSQGYDEMNKLFPNGPRGGKHRSSRKYKTKNKNKKNKTKRRKG